VNAELRALPLALREVILFGFDANGLGIVDYGVELAIPEMRGPPPS